MLALWQFNFKVETKVGADHSNKDTVIEVSGYARIRAINVILPCFKGY